MSIRMFAEIRPNIATSAYVDDDAIVIGQVEIDEDSSIWPGTVLRGDVNMIRIGMKTSIQDNSVIHVTHARENHENGFSTVVGDQVTVGHRAILHGCKIADNCLLGMGSVIMDGVLIESDVILAAGSLVPPRKTLESGYLWMGSPVRRIRKLTAAERAEIQYSAAHYVKLKNRYLVRC